MMPACVRKMRWELSIWNVSGLQLKLTDSLDQESFPHSAGDVISQAQQGGQAVFRYESFLISMLRCLDSTSAVFSSLVVIALCGFPSFLKLFLPSIFSFTVSHRCHIVTTELLASKANCSHRIQIAHIKNKLLPSFMTSMFFSMVRSNLTTWKLTQFLESLDISKQTSSIHNRFYEVFSGILEKNFLLPGIESIREGPQPSGIMECRSSHNLSTKKTNWFSELLDISKQASVILGKFERTFRLKLCEIFWLPGILPQRRKQIAHIKNKLFTSKTNWLYKKQITMLKDKFLRLTSKAKSIYSR